MQKIKYNKKLSQIKAFQWIYARLPGFSKKMFWILFCLMVCTAALETVALGAIAFFASAVTDPQNVISSKYVGFFRQFITADFLDSAKGLIISSGLLMLLLVMGKNSIKALSNYGMERFAVTMEAYFGKKLIGGFLRLPYQWHLGCNSADLINAIQWRVYMGRAFFRPYLALFNDLLMVFIMLLALFIVQPLISFIVLVVLGGSAGFLYLVIRKKIDELSEKAKDYQIMINKETTMAIQGIKDVKISCKEDAFVKKFSDNAVPLGRILGILKIYGGSPVLILETIGFGMLWLSISIMLLRFDITTAYITGTMALLAVTAWKVLPAVSQILNNIAMLRNSLPFIESQIQYFSVIEKNKNVDRPKTEKLFDFLDKIRFENVSFAYTGSDLKVITDFSLDIKKGETIGIIGTSGAGKSTLVSLLMGLLEPVTGRILIDNETLNSDFLETWLKITGYVSQSPYIYDGTLAANIAFGMDNNYIDRKRVRQCCTMASMDDFVHRLPQDIDSLIGERGVKLSGGQQQRVAIARALYHKPEIMVFDEATSSLDTNSEKAIQKTIYSFKGKQTLVIIAHRLTTVEDCDTVIWLEKGKIKMSGDPEIVLNKYHLITK